MDSVKEEGNEAEDIEMDSSCDSDCDNLEAETNKLEEKTLGSNTVSIKTESENVVKKTATKRSKTIPLVTPSTPIVPINCNETRDLPKGSIKHVYAKKPKMCTVCGKLLEVGSSGKIKC